MPLFLKTRGEMIRFSTAIILVISGSVYNPVYIQIYIYIYMCVCVCNTRQWLPHRGAGLTLVHSICPYVSSYLSVSSSIQVFGWFSVLSSVYHTRLQPTFVIRRFLYTILSTLNAVLKSTSMKRAIRIV